MLLIGPVQETKLQSSIISMHRIRLQFRKLDHNAAGSNSTLSITFAWCFRWRFAPTGCVLHPGASTPSQSAPLANTVSPLIRHHNTAPSIKFLARAVENEFDLEAEAEKFMQKQAELESGDTSVPTLEAAVGTDSVPDDVRHPPFTLPLERHFF